VTFLNDRFEAALWDGTVRRGLQPAVVELNPINSLGRGGPRLLEWRRLADITHRAGSSDIDPAPRTCAFAAWLTDAIRDGIRSMAALLGRRHGIKTAVVGSGPGR
jgi:hypothetical protein